MADRTVDPIYAPLTVTTPAGTLAAAPQFTVAGVPRGHLLSVEIQIPPGHAGTTGIRVEVAQQQIVPYSTAASWIVADDYQHEFEVDAEVDQGLRVATFNTGQYDHQHFLRFKIRRIAPARVFAPVALHDTGRLSAS